MKEREAMEKRDRKREQRECGRDVSRNDEKAGCRKEVTGRCSLEMRRIYSER